MSTLVVTGASGMLGEAVLRSALPRFSRILAIHNTRPVRIKADNIIPIQLDLRNQSELLALFQRFKPSAVVHCAAKINLEECEKNFSEALEQNVTVTHHLCEAFLSSVENPKPGSFVVVSSDAVYPDMPIDVIKSEKLTPKPASAYGMSKWWSEHVAERMLEKSALIFRTTIVGGHPSQFVGWLASSAKKGDPIRLFDDVYFTPIAVTQAADIMFTAMEKELHGIFNLGSSQPVSKAHFGEMVISRLHPEAKRSFGSLRDLPAKTSRSFNMALDSNRLAQALGCSLPSAEDVVGECLQLLKVQNDLEKRG